MRSLYNEDLAPAAVRNWGPFSIFNVWTSDVHGLWGYYLAASLFVLCGSFINFVLAIGIGSRLMRGALWRAAGRGHKAVLLVGDAPCYARFGFEASRTARLDLPGYVDRRRFLAFGIEAGALDGVEGMVVASGARASQAAPMLRAA